MKIKYKRFTELSCFTLRDTLAELELRLIQVGFESIVKDLEEMLLINLSLAVISPSVVPHLVELKKKLEKMTSKKIYWITKEKSIGDFATLSVFLSRQQGTKIRQIGDRIILDDEVYTLEKQIAAIEAEIIKLGFDDNTAQKAIQQNIIVKTQKKTLDGTLKWQRKRKTESHLVQSDVDELELKIKHAVDELAKLVGQAVEL